MNLNRRLEPLPEFEIAYLKRYETIRLAVVLIVGLTFVSPVLTAIAGVLILVFVAIVGATYGMLAVLLRWVHTGIIDDSLLYRRWVVQSMNLRVASASYHHTSRIASVSQSA